jgi:hypothetical protein
MNSRRTFTQIEIDAVETLYCGQGMTRKAVAEFLQISPRCVSRLLLEKGWMRRVGPNAVIDARPLRKAMTTADVACRITVRGSKLRVDFQSARDVVRFFETAATAAENCGVLRRLRLTLTAAELRSVLTHMHG